MTEITIPQSIYEFPINESDSTEFIWSHSTDLIGNIFSLENVEGLSSVVTSMTNNLIISTSEISSTWYSGY